MPARGHVDLYSFSGELIGFTGSPVIDVQEYERLELFLVVSAFGGGTLDLGGLARHYAPDGSSLMASPAIGAGNLVGTGARILTFGPGTGVLYGGSIGAQIVHLPAFTKIDLAFNAGTAVTVTGKLFIRGRAPTRR